PRRLLARRFRPFCRAADARCLAPGPAGDTYPDPVFHRLDPPRRHVGEQPPARQPVTRSGRGRLMPVGARIETVFGGARLAISQRPALHRALPALISLVVLLAIAGALIPSFLLPDRL